MGVNMVEPATNGGDELLDIPDVDVCLRILE
jgi:hypothetical protein